ncbi:MAG: class I SAM-dependent methyltransferase [Magnetospirillum sp.]
MPHRIIIDQINTLLGNNRPNEALTVVYQAILDQPHSLEINTNALYLTLNMPPALCAQHLAQVSACHHVVGLETLTDKLITLFSSHPERYELFATLGNILCRLESADLAIKSFDQVLIAAGSADIAAKAIVGEYQATAASYDGVDAHQASGQNFVTLLAECLQGPRHRLNIVDAACGSGLAGPALRPWAASLTGLDLSPTMLAMADQTGLYDRLVEGDMTDTLNAMPESADLLICAGATCYLRDLAPFLAAART